MTTATADKLDSALEIKVHETHDLVSLKTEDMNQKVPVERARELANKIDLSNSVSISSYGLEAQKKVTSVSESMLAGAKSKDLGPVGDTMIDMVTKMRGLDFSQIKPGQKRNFIMRLLGRVTSLTKFIQRYETIESQIATSQNVLEKHRIDMHRSIMVLDKLYEAVLDQLIGLDEHIAGIEYKINEIDTVVLPELQAAADLSKDMLDIQKVNDMSGIRDQLERKRAALLATRITTIQTLPIIRQLQQKEKDLVDKIQTQIILAIPLWKQRMAVSLEAWKALEAGKASKAVTDFTNELIKKSTEAFKETNALIGKEVERNIIDVETVKQSNDLLIAAIEESIQLAEQGKKARAEAEKEFKIAEEKLKLALKNASEGKTSA